ncbi:MAG TPA: thioesterase family protein [Alphaproteobacteria bacterium]|jgi:4-hydroxybenzoyl-CoA thioesterase|nr:thioesterase family protein [Alphaproteobacteria bacterium]
MTSGSANASDGPPPFTLRLPIRFTHTDPAGIVFFPRFFEMIQAAVEEWFTQGLGINFAKFVRDGFGTPTAHTECDFLKPCFLGDFLDIAVTLERVGRTSLELSFVGTVDGEERLRARSVLVLFSLIRRATVPIDGDLRARLERYRERGMDGAGDVAKG